MEKQKKKVTQKFLKLEKLRKRYGLRQSDFALLLGMCASAYSHKENGLSPFIYDEIIRILWALNKKAKSKGHEMLTFEDVFLKEKWQVSEDNYVLLYFKDKYKIWFDDLADHEKLWETRRLLGIDYFNKDYKHQRSK